MNAELHLRIVGVLMLALVALNLYVPRRFGWRREMATLSLLNRQIFQVHAMFISVMLLMFAALCLMMAKHLLEPTPLAGAVLGGLASFWLLRLAAQWLIYDWRLWRGQRFNTAMHLLFTVLWLYFTATFTFALLINLRP
jgi:hypothetical protein